MNYWLTFKLNLQVCHYKYQNQIYLLARIMSSESNSIKLHLPTIQSDWNIDRYQSLWRHLPYNKFKKINRASRNFYYFVFLGLYYVKYNQYMQQPTKQDKMQTLFWTVLLVTSSFLAFKSCKVYKTGSNLVNWYDCLFQIDYHKS